MRPKKKILVYCEDEAKLNVNTFIIGSKTSSTSFGMAAYPVDSIAVAESLAKLTSFHAAVVIHARPSDQSASMVSTMMAMDIPTLLINDCVGSHVADNLASMTISSAAGVAEWMERLRVLCGRKRGPKVQVRNPKEELVSLSVQ